MGCGFNRTSGSVKPMNDLEIPKHVLTPISILVDRFRLEKRELELARRVDGLESTVKALIIEVSTLSEMVHTKMLFDAPPASSNPVEDG